MQRTINLRKKYSSYMLKQGRSSLIILVLLVLLFIILLGIFIFNANSKGNIGIVSDECAQLEKEAFIFGSKNCYSNSASVFTLYSGKEIGALRILVHTDDSVKSVDLIKGASSEKVRNFGGREYITLPAPGEMNTYILSESANALEVIPFDKNGNMCKVSDNIVLSRCDDYLANILDKDISNMPEDIFIQNESSFRSSSGTSISRNSGGGGGGSTAPAGGNLVSPILILHSPLNRTIFNTSQITLNFEVHGEEIADCLYKLGNGNFILLGNCISPTVINASEGEQNLVLRAVNSQDRFDEKVVSIIVDTIYPNLSNFSTNPFLPSSLDWGEVISVDFDSSEFPISVLSRLISDASGVIVNYTSSILIENGNQTNLSYAVPFGLNAGNYTLKLVAVDKAGNTADFFVGTIMINDSYTGTCTDSQIILRLAKESNSHASAWDNTAYAIKICYNEIFGELYLGSNPHNCKSGANNLIAYLYSLNGHLSAPEQSVSGAIEICYGDLECRGVNGNCANDEEEIISLSTLQNAHAEAGYLNNYSYRICCK